MKKTILPASFIPISGLLKNIALILLLFVSITHALVLIVFLTNKVLLPFTFPLALMLSMAISFSIESRWKNKRKECLWAAAVSVGVIGISLLLSWFYYDLSWDGQWYHQAAIYHLESGWNSLLKPIETFDKNNDLSIIHFPKGSWYYAASVLSTFGNPEAGKSINWIILFAGIFMVYATLKDLGLSNIITCYFPVTQTN